MDDVHFILRHAMTGAVFVIFAALGIWLFQVHIDQTWLDLPGGDWAGAAAALAVIAFPIIGITIQGVHYCVYSWVTGKENFNDPARCLVARQVRDAVDACRDLPGIEVNWDYVHRAPDDVFFVWLYHYRATPHMIEWARRRRSYYYLGYNWIIAMVAGFAAAFVLRGMERAPGIWAPIAVALAGIWAAGAWWAAHRMRRDADTMEALWAAAQIHAEFRQSLAKMLVPVMEDGVVDELTGSATRTRKAPARRDRASASPPKEFA